MAPGTRQRGPELGLKNGLHERVVAADVVGQRFGGDGFVRAAVVVLQMEAKIWVNVSIVGTEK